MKTLGKAALALPFLALGGCGFVEKFGEAPQAVVDGVLAGLRWVGQALFELIIGWMGIPLPF